MKTNIKKTEKYVIHNKNSKECKKDILFLSFSKKKKIFLNIRVYYLKSFIL